MTPNWSDAPEWANFVAMDTYGDWWWFEDEPWPGEDMWHDTNGRMTFAMNGMGWRDTKQSRPIKE
jgi:hypothetical protein